MVNWKKKYKARAYWTGASCIWYGAEGNHCNSVDTIGRSPLTITTELNWTELNDLSHSHSPFNNFQFRYVHDFDKLLFNNFYVLAPTTISLSFLHPQKVYVCQTIYRWITPHQYKKLVYIFLSEGLISMGILFSCFFFIILNRFCLHSSIRCVVRTLFRFIFHSSRFWCVIFGKNRVFYILLLNHNSSIIFRYMCWVIRLFFSVKYFNHDKLLFTIDCLDLFNRFLSNSLIKIISLLNLFLNNLFVIFSFLFAFIDLTLPVNYSMKEEKKKSFHLLFGRDLCVSKNDKLAMKMWKKAIFFLLLFNKNFTIVWDINIC